jgi:hypothetical protein
LWPRRATDSAYRLAPAAIPKEFVKDPTGMPEEI